MSIKARRPDNLAVVVALALGRATVRDEAVAPAVRSLVVVLQLVRVIMLYIIYIYISTGGKRQLDS